MSLAPLEPRAGVALTANLAEKVPQFQHALRELRGEVVLLPGILLEIVQLNGLIVVRWLLVFHIPGLRHLVSVSGPVIDQQPVALAHGILVRVGVVDDSGARG